jgi:PAS domain S-box-containing protein
MRGTDDAPLGTRPTGKAKHGVTQDRTSAHERPATGGQLATTQAGVGFGVDVQTVLDAFPYYVMLIDEKHTVLMANRAVREALKVPIEAILGGYCPRLVHDHDEAFPGCPLEAACAHGCSTETELRDDARGRILISGVYPTPLRTQEGRSVFLHTTRDITEQRAAEAALERAERTQATLNQVLKLALEPIALDELFGKVLDVVAALPWTHFEPRSAIFLADEAKRLLTLVAHKNMDALTLGSCAKVAFGQCACGLVAKSRMSTFMRSDDPCHIRHAGRAPSHAHYCAPIAHGSRLLGVLTVYVSADRPCDGAELSLVTSIANALAGIVVARRAEEERLVHERIALTRERMARVGEIATGVAHLVRNPLQGVMNGLEILQEHLGARADPGVGEPIAMMREGLLRIGQVTERLLTLTRDVPRHPVRTAVVDCLEEVRSILHVYAETRGVTLVVDACADCFAEIDASRFVEAVVNVARNAIDASQDGGQVSMQARLQPAPDAGIAVVVEDRGIGMSAEIQSHAFDPFFSTKAIDEGSGLGLAITKRIMDEHGGAVTLDSEPGHGTRVTLTFPA